MERAENVESLSPEEVGRLLERLRPALYRLCLAGVRRPSVAEELVQQTLLVAFSNTHRFDASKESFRRWVLGIARRVCGVAGRRRIAPSQALSELRAEDPAPSPLDRLMHQDQRRVVADATASLTPEEEAALYLRLDGRSLLEIQRTLGLGAESVRNLLTRQRVWRALSRHRAELAEVG